MISLYDLINIQKQVLAMNKIKNIWLTSLYMIAGLYASAYGAPSWNGGIVDGDFSMNGGDTAASIEITTGNSLNVNSSGMPVDNVTFTVTGDITLDGDLLHNAGLAGAGSGSFSVLGNGTQIRAGGDIDVTGKIESGDGILLLEANEISANSLDVSATSSIALNANKVTIAGDANFADGSAMFIATDYTKDPTFESDNLNVGGGIFMGGSVPTGTAVSIVSGDSDNVYTFSATGNVNVNGDINADSGKLVINGDTAFIDGDLLGNIDLGISNDVNVTGGVNTNDGKLTVNADDVKIADDVSGEIDFNVNSLSIGNALVDPNTSLGWKSRFTNTGTGDLLADGNIVSVDDIIIGGNVDGELNITSAKDMWIGEDLLGYWAIDVSNLYVLGNAVGGGNITADTINVGGDLSSDPNDPDSTIKIIADEINVDGNLSGNLDIDAGNVFVNGDVLGGTKFRPNLPLGQHDPINVGTLPEQFHVNPDTGISADFKQIDMTVNGTYYFNDDSYLQLVLNSSNISGAVYDPLTDGALLKVGGFNASSGPNGEPGVTRVPDFSDMDSSPNIEILVDNIDEMIRRIRIMEITDPMGVVDLGMLNYAGVWFYWDDDNDGINDRRLFQESRLIADGNNIYAQLAMMQSIEKLTLNAPGHNGNDRAVAGAIDDLVLGRLRKYAGYTNDDLNNYYTSVMRLLFNDNDVYYDLVLNGGALADVVDVMVAEDPSLALNFVRGVGLYDVSAIGSQMALSSHISRNAVSDQLIEDFTWKRYYDKHLAWLRMGFGDDVNSFNFGADTKIRKYIVGFNVGYNALDFGSVDGSTINLGAYGTYDYRDWGRLYANANLAIHSLKVHTDSNIVGQIDSKFTTVDTTLDVGLLHKIFDQYITGRAYLTLGYQGGYEFTQKYHGRDYMDINADSKFVFAPGYEISLGKDIWFSVNSFMRPSIKVGVEYDLAGSGNRDFDFKFAEVNNWRSWSADSNSALWLRYGGQIDFSWVVGTNIGIGYEVLKNGDFEINQFKVNGIYRF
ncbi:hypothetical protein LJC18_04195 [Lachnospiraceae bacterium OttesenSCG-928-E19]|nr:hypothetical protein [Lachnospiraceae bacterium OttesenSCG-928-E19]